MRDLTNNDTDIRTICDVGPYPVYSTVLAAESPLMDEPERRERLFFAYAIGGQVPGAKTTFHATYQETNVRVPNMFVGGDWMSIEAVYLAIPRMALAVYQRDPDSGPYKVTEEDVAALAATTHCAFYSGGEKPFIEVVLANKPVVRLAPSDLDGDGRIGLDKIFSHDGGWLVQLGNLKRTPLKIGQIEKFWGTVRWAQEFPHLGRHGYNPAVIPLVMILDGQRSRGVQ